jgi:hypothetical protein
MRVFPSFAFILTLIRHSIRDMVEFFIVLNIVNQAFIFGYLRTTHSCLSLIASAETCVEAGDHG